MTTLLGAMEKQIDRTTWRRMQKDKPDQQQSWVAPEHSRHHNCRRIKRDVVDRDGTVLIPKGTLLLPEPDCLHHQRLTERKIKLANEQHELATSKRHRRPTGA